VEYTLSVRGTKPSACAITTAAFWYNPGSQPPANHSERGARDSTAAVSSARNPIANAASTKMPTKADRRCNASRTNPASETPIHSPQSTRGDHQPCCATHNAGRRLSTRPNAIARPARENTAPAVISGAGATLPVIDQAQPGKPMRMATSNAVANTLIVGKILFIEFPRYHYHDCPKHFSINPR
jgi:hypothetical protein